MSKYKEPVLKHYNWDISKRWYVEYYYWDETIGKKRQIREFGTGNNIKSLRKRKSYYKEKLETIQELLLEGWNPLTGENFEEGLEDITSTLFVKRLEEAYETHKPRVSKQSQRGNFFKIQKLIKWLKQNNLETLKADEFTKRIYAAYLDHMEKSNNWSPTTYNNHIRELSPIFEIMIRNDWMQYNPSKALKITSSKPTLHKVFTREELESIVAEIKAKNDGFYLLVKLVSYCMLRPIEAVRIRIRDINIENNTFVVDTKTKNRKIRRIPPQLVEELSSYKTEYPDHYYIIHKSGKPNTWDVSDSMRREYFSRLFTAIKRKLQNQHQKNPKENPEIDTSATLYSFRHTFISDLYHNYESKGLEPIEIKTRLMRITGHETIKALEKYLRDIQIDVPDDYFEDFTYNI